MYLNLEYSVATVFLKIKLRWYTADDISKYNFCNKTAYITIEILLKLIFEAHWQGNIGSGYGARYKSGKKH